MTQGLGIVLDLLDGINLVARIAVAHSRTTSVICKSGNARPLEVFGGLGQQYLLDTVELYEVSYAPNLN